MRSCFTLAYKAVHDKNASDFEMNYFKKFFGVAAPVSVPDPVNPSISLNGPTVDALQTA